MRKFKIYSSISLISGLLLVLASVLVPIIKLSNYTAQNGSVGIIGGTDAPTLLFLLKYSDGHLLFALILGLTLFLCGGFCLIFKRTVMNNCRLKTTALSLIISFFGASGLSCFYIWYSIVSFHAMSEHPISHPASIVGGFLSLAAFILSIFFYVKMRKGDWPIKGVLLDAVVAYLSLPVFFFWLMEHVYPWLQRLV